MVDKRLNPGGPSHKRAMARAAIEHADQPATSTDQSENLSPVATNIHVPAERILRFVDSAHLQTLAGIVGGLVGTFLDGRYFTVLCIMASLALKQSNALEGVGPKWKLAWHFAAVSVAAWLLFYMGIKINQSRPQTFTPSDYAKAIKNNTSLPIVQQITNIYKSYQTTKKEGPRIDFSEFQLDSVTPQRMSIYVDAINNGDRAALDVKGSASAMFGNRLEETEDSLFAFLSKHSSDAIQPRHDQPPGEKYKVKEPLIFHAPSPSELGEINTGQKVLYMGRMDTYRDSDGNEYESEICMFWTNTAAFQYCDGHNRMRRLGSRR